MTEQQTPPRWGSDPPVESGTRRGLAGLPLWVRLAIVALLATVAILLRKWLILLLLLALGLWPITLLIGLILLAIISIWHGGWPWMKQWLATRLRGLVVPALSVFTALLIGGIILILTDQEVYQTMQAEGLLTAIQVGLSNWRRLTRPCTRAHWATPADP